MTITPRPTNYIDGQIYSASDVNGTNTNLNLATAALSLVDAKGDILTGISDDTLTKTAVGANNTVLYANSSATGGVSWGTVTSAMITDGTITGTDIASSTVTNANLAGSIAYNKLVLTGSVTNADLAGGIADSKLSTISTAGKVSNSATTATSSSTASAIVARDADESFNAKTGYFGGGYLGGLDYTKAVVAGNSGTITTNGEGVVRVGKYGLNTTGITINQQGSSGTSYHISFYRSSANVGSISENGSTTSFNTTSDYRLKTELGSVSDALARLSQLRPISFTFNNAPGIEYDGFLAHEVDAVVPAAVTGEKDAVNTDGSILPQQIDHSKLVPLLVAAVQELSHKVAALSGE